MLTTRPWPWALMAITAGLAACALVDRKPKAAVAVDPFPPVLATQAQPLSALPPGLQHIASGQDVLTVIAQALQLGLGQASLRVEVSRSGAESAAHLFVTIWRDRYLDDSLRGEWLELTYQAQPGGRWQLQAARRAWSCWRGATQAYQANLCP